MDGFQELYAARRDIRRLIKGKIMFMEDIASLLMEAFPGAVRVEVRLLTGRHVVIQERKVTVQVVYK